MTQTKQQKQDGLLALIIAAAAVWIINYTLHPQWWVLLLGFFIATGLVLNMQTKRRANKNTAYNR
jgi:Flp pilus assembly protein TadB